MLGPTRTKIVVLEGTNKKNFFRQEGPSFVPHPKTMPSVNSKMAKGPGKRHRESMEQTDEDPSEFQLEQLTQFILREYPGKVDVPHEKHCVPHIDRSIVSST